MEFTTTLEKFNSNLWTYHVPIPDAIANQIIKQGSKRIIAVLNNEIKIQSALLPDGNGCYFINVNQEIRKKLQLEIGDQVHIQLIIDKSKYGMEFPDELKELFEFDLEGDKLFHQLTPGKQRNLLYIINKPKSSSIRLEKAIVIIDYLKSTNGKLDFKALNQAIKESNELRKLKSRKI